MKWIGKSSSEHTQFIFILFQRATQNFSESAKRPREIESNENFRNIYVSPNVFFINFLNPAAVRFFQRILDTKEIFILNRFCWVAFKIHKTKVPFLRFNFQKIIQSYQMENCCKRKKWKRFTVLGEK
jgi:hypothetical protein